MSAYVVAEFTIDAQAAYVDYRERARQAITGSGGLMLVRGGAALRREVHVEAHGDRRESVTEVGKE